jgi:hypothetical protein
MKTYLLSHWRGEQPLLRSFLVNGLLAYVALVLVVIALGPLLPRTALHPVMALFVLFLAWSGVGIVRAALRLFSRPESRLPARVAAVFAIGTVGLVAWAAAGDLRRLLGF